MQCLKVVFEPFVSFLQILIFNGRALGNFICVQYTTFWLTSYVKIWYMQVLFPSSISAMYVCGVYKILHILLRDSNDCIHWQDRGVLNH